MKLNSLEFGFPKTWRKIKTRGDRCHRDVTVI